MSKPEKVPFREGVLIRPFEAFYGACLPVDTIVAIISEDDDKYTVRFPNQVGYTGTHRIKKTYVREFDLT
jgi:hypothetical protein